LLIDTSLICQITVGGSALKEKMYRSRKSQTVKRFRRRSGRCCFSLLNDFERESGGTLVECWRMGRKGDLSKLKVKMRCLIQDWLPLCTWTKRWSLFGVKVAKLFCQAKALSNDIQHFLEIHPKLKSTGASLDICTTYEVLFHIALLLGLSRFPCNSKYHELDYVAYIYWRSVSGTLQNCTFFCVSWKLESTVDTSQQILQSN